MRSDSSQGKRQQQADCVKAWQVIIGHIVGFYCEGDGDLIEGFKQGMTSKVHFLTELLQLRIAWSNGQNEEILFRSLFQKLKQVIELVQTKNAALEVRDVSTCCIFMWKSPLCFGSQYCIMVQKHGLCCQAAQIQVVARNYLLWNHTEFN